MTGIRHWSASDYTRVAIDVESNVKFVSRRIDNPSRIVFDLRDTKLASTLVGKTFDGTTAFLKKVRVAQLGQGSTRVVLEVDDLSDYDAFLLPDPYRLIIDIHGKDIHGRDIHGNDKSAPADVADGESSPTGPGVVSSDEAAVPASDNSVAGKKAPTSVVKKIVEADDDTSASSAELAKRNNRVGKKSSLRARKAVVARTRANGEVEGDAEAPDANFTQFSDLGIHRRGLPRAGTGR